MQTVTAADEPRPVLWENWDSVEIFIPVKNDSQIIDKLPERGSKINLEEFGLSERQIKFVKDYLKNMMKIILKICFMKIKLIKCLLKI